MRRDFVFMHKQVVFVLTGILLSTVLNAQTWLPSKRLTWNMGDSDAPATITDSYNHTHVVWHDDTPGNKEIFYKKSTDGGATWTSAKRLTWNSGDSEFPAIATDSSNNVHVVWHDDTPGNKEIFYKKSTDGGATWTSAKRLTWNSGYSREPAIEVDAQNTIHVIWHDSSTGTADIYYTRSTNGGTTWSTKRLTWNFGFSANPDIMAVSNNNIYVVWEDRSSGNYEIYFKKSTDSGVTWEIHKRLTWTSDSSSSPKVTTDSNNNIFLVYNDITPGNYEIYYKKSTNGGTTWNTKRLTWTATPSTNPTIATDSNNFIHIFWQEGSDKIYHKRSTNGGSSWTIKRLTWTSVWSYWPDIAIDSLNRIHLVWRYGFIGNGEIYYRRGDQ
jgi:hypothetical protein